MLLSRPCHEQRAHRTQDADADGKQDRNGNGPTLVECYQEEVGEQHREAQDHRGLPSRLLLLQGSTGPLVAEALGQRGVGEVLHGGDRLARAPAGRRPAIEGHAAIVVVADDGLRPQRQPRLGEGAQRHHLSLPVADMDAVDVVDLGPVGGLGLDVDLPGAAEQIEVVDVEAAENGLERVEHVADADAQGLHLVAVDVEIELGRVGGVGGEHCPEGRVLVGGEDEPASGCGELGRIAAPKILELVLEAAAGAEPDDRRQVEGDHVGLADRLELGAQLGEQAVDAERRVVALLEGLQQHDQEAAIGLRQPVDEAVAYDRADVRDALGVEQDLLHPLGHRSRPVHGRTFGELQLDEEGTLVLARQEAGRGGPERLHETEDDGGEQDKPDHGTADQELDHGRITVARLVDAGHHVAHRSPLGAVRRLQQDGTEGGG